MTDAPLADPSAVVVRTATLEAEVGDGLLVIDPARVRAHGLNPSAAAVWRATLDPAPVAAVVQLVASGAGLTPDAVDADVRTALARFGAEGLVQLGDDPPPPVLEPHQRPGAFANVPATDEPVPAAFSDHDWPTPIGPFRGLDAVFDLTTTDARLARALAEVFQPLAIGGAPVPGPVRRYRLGPDPLAVAAGAAGAEGHDDPPLLLALDDRVIARPRRAADAMALVVWHANQLVSTATARFLQLHAAGVVVDGTAVLLPAAMNSGKSTLTTGMVAAGAGYLTDETVAIDPGSGALLPYPKAVSLDPGSWPLFPSLEPRSTRDEPGLGHHKWYVAPDAIRPGAAVVPSTGPDDRPVADVPIGSVVFPRYDPGGGTVLRPLEPLDAAATLAANAFNLLALGQPGLDALVRLATTTRCWSLAVADLDDGVAAVLDAARRA